MGVPMVASLQVQLAAEPAVTKLIAALCFGNTQASRLCSASISAKGLRLATEYLGTEQINVYLPAGTFEQYELGAAAETAQTAFHANALLESLLICISGRTKAASAVSLSWADNLDHVAIRYPAPAQPPLTRPG